MSHKWNTEARFKTADDYIDAHAWAREIDAETREALRLVIVKRNGIWSPRVSVPKDPKTRAAWEAYRTTRHVVNWGYLPSHGSHGMVAFFFDHPELREYYLRLLDKFEALALIQKALRAAANKS